MKSILLTAPLLATLVSGFVWTVGVGKDETNGRKGIGFDPSSIRPASGDSVEFVFQGGRHSAVESTFDNPCTPKEGGFATSVQTVDDSLRVDAPGLPTETFAITTTDPIWFFDQASGDCNKGALFSINPPLTGAITAGAWKEKALALPSSGSDDDATTTTTTEDDESATGAPSSTRTGTTGTTGTADSATTTPSPSPTNAAELHGLGAQAYALGLLGLFLGFL